MAAVGPPPPPAGPPPPSEQEEYFRRFEDYGLGNVRKPSLLRFACQRPPQPLPIGQKTASPGANKTDLISMSSYGPFFTPIDVDLRAAAGNFLLDDEDSRGYIANSLPVGNPVRNILSRPHLTEGEKKWFWDFANWLAGCPQHMNDRLRTPWLRDHMLWQKGEARTQENRLETMVPGDDVSLFLGAIVTTANRYKCQLDLLKTAFSGGLQDSFLYYKYIVRPDDPAPPPRVPGAPAPPAGYYAAGGGGDVSGAGGYDVGAGLVDQSPPTATRPPAVASTSGSASSLPPTETRPTEPTATVTPPPRTETTSTVTEPTETGVRVRVAEPLPSTETATSTSTSSTTSTTTT